MYSNYAYMDNKIESAEPLELVRMLYRGAYEGIQDARAYLAQGDIPARTRKLNKASAIVNELNMSLDRTAGGEISQRLEELYQYLQGLIVQANIEQRDQPLAEAGKLLGTLLEGWESCRPEPEFAHDPLAYAVSHSY